MERCKTCKHWVAVDKYDTGHSLGLGRCAETPMLWDSTQWSDDGDRREFVKTAESTTAFVQDGSDYKAWLYTKPGHGCVMHKA